MVYIFKHNNENTSLSFPSTCFRIPLQMLQFSIGGLFLNPIKGHMLLEYKQVLLVLKAPSLLNTAVAE